MVESDQLVQCINCGYLAVEFPDASVRRASRTCRQKGHLDQPPDSKHPAKLICFKDAHEFWHGRANTREDLVREINADRKCSSFTKLSEGKTPQEHEAMELLELVKADNAATKVAIESRQDKADHRQKWAIGISVCALIVSVLMGLAGPLMVEYVKRQWGWVPDAAPMVVPNPIDNLDPPP